MRQSIAFAFSGFVLFSKSRQAIQQSGFTFRQQIGHGGDVIAEGLGEFQGNGHIDADDGTTGRKAELPGSPQDDVPGLPTSFRQGFVLLVGTGAFTPETVVPASPTVSWAPTEMPCGAGPDAFPSAARSSRGPR